MNYTFTTNNGKEFEIDLSKWMVEKKDCQCKIIDVSEGNVILENKSKDIFSIPENIIAVNGFNIQNSTLTLTKSLYEHWFLSKCLKETRELFESLYERYATQIFQNRELVMNIPEYYLLKPSNLSCGFMYTGGTSYSLGRLFESFESGKHVYYEEFCGFKKMFLLSMAASPLTGIIYSAHFWSEDSKRFVRYDKSASFPKGFSSMQGRALIETLRGKEIKLDRQDVVVKRLINEISNQK